MLYKKDYSKNYNCNSVNNCKNGIIMNSSSWPNWALDIVGNFHTVSQFRTKLRKLKKADLKKFGDKYEYKVIPEWQAFKDLNEALKTDLVNYFYHRLRSEVPVNKHFEDSIKIVSLVRNLQKEGKLPAGKVYADDHSVILHGDGFYLSFDSNPIESWDEFWVYTFGTNEILKSDAIDLDILKRIKRTPIYDRIRFLIGRISLYRNLSNGECVKKKENEVDTVKLEKEAVDSLFRPLTGNYPDQIYIVSLEV